MAWTTPGTATAGEVLTAAFWNEQVRDNLNALDAAGANAVGSVLIASADFSAASSVLVESVFSADYVNYLVGYQADTSVADRSITVSFLNGSTPYTSLHYLDGYMQQTGSSSAASQDRWNYFGLGDDEGTGRSLCWGEIMSPFSTDREAAYVSRTWSPHPMLRMAGGNLTVTTSFDGFRFVPVSGTMTGRYWVYGLRNA